MPPSRRAVLGLSAGLAVSLTGCAGAPQPPEPTVRRLRAAVQDAYRRDGAAVVEAVGFSAENLGDDFGWAVVADFKLPDGNASVETMRRRFNRTAILVFDALYATDVSLSDPTVRGFVMWDDPRDLSERKKQQQLARATVGHSTASTVNFRTLEPSELPEIADGYAFEERYLEG